MRSGKELQAGAMVRCPKCNVVFKLGEDAKSAPKPAPERTVPPVPKSASEKSSPPAPRSKPPVNKSSIAAGRTDDRPPVSRRRSDDDYDDYDDRDRRPRRRRRQSAKGGGNATVLLVVGGLVALLVVVGGLGLVGYLVFGGKKTATPPALAANNALSVTPSVQAPNPGMASAIPKKPTRETSPAIAKKPESPPPDLTSAPASPTSAGSADIFSYVLKSTVLILNVVPRGVANGTGSVVDANERLILTNYHVVENSQSLIVLFPIYEGGKLVAERERYLNIFKEKTKSPSDLLVAEIVATDPLRDLALIRVPKIPAGTESLPLAKNAINIGQTVHSLGNPGVSGSLWVYTQGAVRAVYRKKWKAGGGDGSLLTVDSEVVETSSPTNPGDSGGPLVNDRGELVGVTEGYLQGGRQISLFISLNEARDFIERSYQRKFAKAWSAPAGRHCVCEVAGAAEM